jgi:hypothetical protein
MTPCTYDFPMIEGSTIAFSDGKRKDRVNTRASIPCSGIIPERRRPFVPKDKREPTDEPCLPGDPGDEPD